MMEAELKIIGIIEEQLAVQFTGKINILASFNRQYLGHILFRNGEIFEVIFNGHKSLKAFYQLIIQEYSLQSFYYVVEPEVVEENQRQIHYPFSVIKNKMSDVIKQYQDASKYRPPENVKILIESNFLHQKSEVTPQEFEVLQVITEWSKPFDIYQHCQLLDHEVTWALVSLRKKKALKILAPKNNGDDSV
jgi:hypothetical protein